MPDNNSTWLEAVIPVDIFCCSDVFRHFIPVETIEGGRPHWHGGDMMNSSVWHFVWPKQSLWNRYGFRVSGNASHYCMTASLRVIFRRLCKHIFDDLTFLNQ